MPTKAWIVEQPAQVEQRRAFDGEEQDQQRSGDGGELLVSVATSPQEAHRLTHPRRLRI